METNQVERVLQKLTELDERLEVIKDATLEEIKFRDIKIAQAARSARTGFWVGVVGCVVGVLGLTVGYFGWDAIQDKKDADAKIRVVACHQYNLQQDDKRTGVVLVAVGSLEGLADDPDNLTPEQIVIRDRIRARAQRIANETFSDRDCSPEGIRKYLGQK